jgi:7-carboxy-7-deazaguanine synthase
MAYMVKEMYYTLQGEGANTGRPAVFCRFAGCNLWSGREEDRHKAICQFCDTDFFGLDGAGGGKFSTAEDLTNAIFRTWPSNGTSKKFVVCTGGEPLLQMDETLVNTLHAQGFEIAVETNGTQLPPNGIDWICVSPKADADFVLRVGDELKVVYPQEGIDPQDFEDLDFDNFFVQPMDGPEIDRNTKLAQRFCLENPKWRLSLQTHKILDIP